MWSIIKNITPMEASQHKHLAEWVMPQPAPRTDRTTIKEMVERTATNRREQPRESISDETRLKQGMDGDTFTSTSSGAQSMTTMSTIIPTITKSLTSTDSFPRPITEIVGTMGVPFQGRLSTLSSVVRPMPTTATRTVAITREESRQHALETARQLIGSTSSTAFMHVLTTISTSRELHPNENKETNQSRVETRTRPSSPTTVSRMTPIGMATPIAQDLIWPGHPDIQGTSLFPGMMIHLLWQLEDQILKKDGRSITHMISQELEDLLWIPLTI